VNTELHPVEHSRVDVCGFEVIDCTHLSVNLIWVGSYGEGRWLTPAQARELADKILSAATAASARKRVEPVLGSAA
jgi:hypothetical protein